MGRELKRVPLDFDWPDDRLWPGYCIGPVYATNENSPPMDEDLEDKWQEYFSERKIHPPEGDGYQVWETVSEGSPIGPVFATASACVEWLVQQGYSKEGAEAFIESGWAPSFAVCGGVTAMGPDALVLLAKDKER
jgi:hypothetical protein